CADFVQRYGALRDLHSFPTRRSSDLDNTVVTDMDIGHQQIVIANGCFAAILYCAAMNSHTFANHIMIANHQARGFALVFQIRGRSEEHTSELQSRENLVCRLLLEKKN